jgi:hypothetical protein
MTTEDKIAALVTKMQAERAAYYDCYYPGPFTADTATVRAVPGKRYTKIDVGPTNNWSGRYMVESDTGRIFGIKGYGVIHRGHYYGTLDTIHDFFWGAYTAVPVDQFKIISLIRR